MLWRVRFGSGTLGWVEVGSGRLFDDAGGAVTKDVDYETTDTKPAPPKWYVEPPVVPPAPIVLARHVTKSAFRNRFTQAERVALEIAALDTPLGTTAQRQAAAGLRANMADQRDAAYIDLDRATTRSGVLRLEQGGLLAAGRALAILDAPVQPDEVPGSV